MAQDGPELRQATMVAVDVFGFARGTEDDQQKIAPAFAALTARLEAAAERHAGRIFNGSADGFLMEFPGAAAAMKAAEEIATGPWPPVRVGVHQSMVMAMPDGNLVGQAVDVVHRIMRMADSGTVLISEDVKRAVQTVGVSRRLNREPAPLILDKPGELVSLYRLSYIEPVDPVARRKTNNRLILITAGLTLFVVAAVALFFGRDIVTTLAPRHDHVAVLAFRTVGGARTASDFAEGLTSEIDYVLKVGEIPTVSGLKAESLRSSNRGSDLRRLQVGAILDGSVAGSGAHLDIKLRIDDPVHHQTLWSHEFTGAGDDLKTPVASRVIGILTCSARALRPGANVGGPAVVALYLKFCDLDADAASDTNALIDEERILRQLTRTAPEFTYGHSNLALFLISKSEIDAADARALREDARIEADRALALDLKNSDGYVARAKLVAPPGWEKREKNLTLALSMPSPGPDPSVVYAQMLPEVGRLRDATAFARKGARLSPWDADILGFSAVIFAQAGRTDDADLALTTSLQMAPANPVVQVFRYHIYQWLGRWDDALKILNDEAGRPPQLGQEDDPAASRAFMMAMKSTDTAAKVAARDAELASVQRDRSHLMTALGHLSALGFTEDVYRLVAQVPPSAQTDDVSALFTPLMDPVRRDPRFIPLAARLGLVAYWNVAGKWPDFCAAGDLPYNCKTEAQKIAAD